MSHHDPPIDELAHLKSLLEQGDTRAVVKACEQRLAINEQDGASWYLLGQAHRFEDTYDMAATALRRACALEANASYVLAFGIALQLDGQLEAATDILEQGTSRWERHPKLHNSLGLTYKKLSRYLDARKSYSSALYWHSRNLIEDNQSSYLRPHPHPQTRSGDTWRTLYGEATVRIETAPNQSVQYMFDYVSDEEQPSRGLFWLDTQGADGTPVRQYLVDGVSAFYWLLRRDNFYATCLGNLSSVVRLMGEEELADAYLAEADDFMSLDQSE